MIACDPSNKVIFYRMIHQYYNYLTESISFCACSTPRHCWPASAQQWPSIKWCERFSGIIHRDHDTISPCDTRCISHCNKVLPCVYLGKVDDPSSSEYCQAVHKKYNQVGIVRNFDDCISIFCVTRAWYLIFGA